MRYVLIVSAFLTLQNAAASGFDETVALAKQGDAEVQHNLGGMYTHGEGAPENDAEAFKWYRKAAEPGDALAQSVLGHKYYLGDGVPENYVKAHVWWSMAKTQGHENSKKVLEILKPNMTKQQISEAQTLATKCYESGYKDCDWLEYQYGVKK